MKPLLVFCFAGFWVTSSFAQCDFLGKDTLFATVQQDTIYLWEMDACTYCSAEFHVSVIRSSDTIYVVQTDTAGRIATCQCLFNLRATITGLPSGTYWIVVYRDLLKKYGYRADTHEFIGALQCTYQPATSPGLSWKGYQSSCISNSVPEKPRSLPGEFALEQIYPNPFNPGTTIQFRISRAEHVVLKVYDVLGREVSTVLAARTEPGTHSVIFRMPRDLTSGVYYCRMTAGAFVQTKAMVLLR